MLGFNEAEYVDSDVNYAQEKQTELRQEKKLIREQLSTGQQAYREAIANYETLAKQIEATKGSLKSSESERFEFSHDSFLPSVSENLLHKLKTMAGHNIVVDTVFLSFNQLFKFTILIIFKIKRFSIINFIFR